MRAVVFVAILMLSGYGGFIGSFAANAIGGMAGGLLYDEAKERLTEYGKDGIKEKTKDSPSSGEETKVNK